MATAQYCFNQLTLTWPEVRDPKATAGFSAQVFPIDVTFTGRGGFDDCAPIGKPSLT
jgi:hypothetical protein